MSSEHAIERGVPPLLLCLNLGDVFLMSFSFVFNDPSMRTALPEAKMCPLEHEITIGHRIGQGQTADLARRPRAGCSARPVGHRAARNTATEGLVGTGA
jgi:hypothetical protein